jgi:hypothetical protein
MVNATPIDISRSITRTSDRALEKPNCWNLHISGKLITAINTDSKKGTIRGANCFKPVIMMTTAAATIKARDADENESIKTDS